LTWQRQPSGHLATLPFWLGNCNWGPQADSIGRPENATAAAELGETKKTTFFFGGQRWTPAQRLINPFICAPGTSVPITPSCAAWVAEDS